MNVGIVLTLPPGNQIDLEMAVTEFIEKLNINTTMKDEAQAWGECRVRQGNIIHGVQWSVTDDGDCEIDCSWHDTELTKELLER